MFSSLAFDFTILCGVCGVVMRAWCFAVWVCTPWVGQRAAATGAHSGELPSGALICKVQSVSKAPAVPVLTLLLASSSKRHSVMWGLHVGWICGLGTLYLWTLVWLPTNIDLAHSSCTWLSGMILFSKLVMASLLCCMNAGNRFYSSTTATGETEEGKNEKLLGTIQRTSYLWNYIWSFPYVPIPFLSIFWSWSLFVQITAGKQHIIHYLYSTFFRVDHTFTWINRFPGTLSIITYLELFLYTLGRLRLESHLFSVWDHDYCVSLPSAVSFSLDSRHLSFFFTRYFC